LGEIIEGKRRIWALGARNWLEQLRELDLKLELALTIEITGFEIGIGLLVERNS
jgi:hypothetical protein